MARRRNQRIEMLSQQQTIRVHCKHLVALLVCLFILCCPTVRAVTYTGGVIYGEKRSPNLQYCHSLEQFSSPIRALYVNVLHYKPKDQLFCKFVADSSVTDVHDTYPANTPMTGSSAKWSAVSAEILGNDSAIVYGGVTRDFSQLLAGAIVPSPLQCSCNAFDRCHDHVDAWGRNIGRCGCCSGYSIAGIFLMALFGFTGLCFALCSMRKPARFFYGQPEEPKRIMYPYFLRQHVWPGGQPIPNACFRYYDHNALFDDVPVAPTTPNPPRRPVRRWISYPVGGPVEDESEEAGGVGQHEAAEQTPSPPPARPGGRLTQHLHRMIIEDRVPDAHDGNEIR